MKKLYALEDNLDNNGNDLLIDKVLAYSEKKDDPITVTADIIKQRQNLKKDIENKLNLDKEEEEKEESSIDDSSDDKDDDTNNESEDTDKDNGSKDDSDDDKDDKDDDSEDDSKDDNDDDDDKDDDSKDDDSKDDKDDDPKDDSKNDDDDSKENDSKKKDDDNDSAVAENKEDLKSIIGSGLKKDSGSSNSSNKTDTKDNSDNNIAKESLSIKPTLKLNNIFNPIKNKYKKYLLSLESFNVPFKLAIEEQPIVYVKDSVLESLNNLISIANNYITKNKTFIDDNIKSIKNINERLTVIGQFIKNRKYHFNNKLINDSELLSNLSVLDKSSLRETSKYLIHYITNSNKTVNFILNNKFEDIATGLSNSEFISENEDFVYKDMLPGFNLIRVHLEKYSNYLKTNIEEFQYYKLRIFKTENLYNLEAISITEDKELDYLISNLDKLLIDLSLTMDNFNDLNSNLNKLIDELKVIIYDVENNKYTNLANIDIDTKVKDFIKFKLISEIYYINVSLIINYILNGMSVINNCIELKT